jgi:hypothetical protein
MYAGPSVIANIRKFVSLYFHYFLALLTFLLLSVSLISDLTLISFLAHCV